MSSAGRSASPLSMRSHLLWAIFAAATLLAFSLQVAGAGTPAAVSIAALAMALTLLSSVRSRRVAVVAGAGGPTYPSGTDAPPVLAGRATDPVHHPLRPRAPGRA